MLANEKKLEAGDIVAMSSGRFIVVFVNESRAHCIPVETKRVVIRDKFSDRTREFTAHMPGLDISPYSDVRIGRTHG